LIHLAWDGDFIFKSSWADSTCSIHCISNQRELGLMAPNNSSNYFSAVNSHFQQKLLLVSEGKFPFGICKAIQSHLNQFICLIHNWIWVFGSPFFLLAIVGSHVLKAFIASELVLQSNTCDIYFSHGLFFSMQNILIHYYFDFLHIIFLAESIKNSVQRIQGFYWVFVFNFNHFIEICDFNEHYADIVIVLAHMPDTYKAKNQKLTKKQIVPLCKYFSIKGGTRIERMFVNFWVSSSRFFLEIYFSLRSFSSLNVRIRFFKKKRNTNRKITFSSNK